MLKRIADSAGGKGIVPTLVGTGVGAAAFYGATYASQHVQFLQSRWWATPTALVLLGHVAKRWSMPTGQAAVGAGGALLGFSYYVQSQANANPQTAPAPAPAPAGALVSRMQAPRAVLPPAQRRVDMASVRAAEMLVTG